MPEEISPRHVALAVKAGFERTRNYRRARAMFMNAYSGQYFRADKRLGGLEPINLIFNAIRATVPQIVMKNPSNKIGTDYLMHKFYAELLSLAVDRVEKDINLKDTIREWVVDAFFGIGILKTSLCASGQCLVLDDRDVDPGAIYTERISIDNFTFDPDCTALDRSWFMGDRVRLPRAELLAMPNINVDLVAKLGSAQQNVENNKRTELLSKKRLVHETMQNLRDYVDVVQVWIPSANIIVLMPDPQQAIFDEFISTNEYYGPDDGMYTFLPLTPPVPDNPLPVAPVGIWYDLHKMANEMFVKIMDQAGRQKDLVFYEPGNADEAQEAWEAPDGTWIKSSNPKGFAQVNLGGQEKGNEVWLAQLATWFNFVSGNPEQMGGQKSNAKTATQAEILQANATVSLEDVRGIVYDRTSQVSKKIAWFLHYDPLIQVPLVRRVTGGQDQQVWLTPEQKRGDFLEYFFKLLPKSMQKLDPIIRTKRIIEYASTVIPQAVMAATAMLQLGYPFNLQRYLTKIAEEMDIGDWINDMFDDPEFRQRLQLQMLMGPMNPGGGKVGQNGGGSAQSTQNGGYANVQRKTTSPQQDQNAEAQTTSAISQSARIAGVF
jgi:hypothetical protein